jgi:hypothetical protein
MPQPAQLLSSCACKPQNPHSTASLISLLCSGLCTFAAYKATLVREFVCVSHCCRVGTATGIVLVIGGVALYIRFVKGWRFSDLMYVTRSSLSSMTETMKSGEGSCEGWRSSKGSISGM